MIGFYVNAIALLPSILFSLYIVGSLGGWVPHNQMSHTSVATASERTPTAVACVHFTVR